MISAMLSESMRTVFEPSPHICPGQSTSSRGKHDNPVQSQGNLVMVAAYPTVFNVW